jgi:hypothetical protein
MRRLVSENNKFELQENIHKEGSALRKSGIFYLSFLQPSVYCDHGKHANYSFSYGTMNEKAFVSILHERGGTNTSSFGFDVNLFSSDDEYTSEAELPNEQTPAMDLDVDIEVRCPPELAPLQYLDQINVPSFEERTNGPRSCGTRCAARTCQEEEFLLKVTWRGPSTFEYVIKSSDFCGQRRGV